MRPIPPAPAPGQRILLIPAMGISLRTKLQRIDKEEAREHEASDD